MEDRIFTQDERLTIDSIYARNKENLTPDEVDLLLAWETQIALKSAAYQQELDNMQSELELQIANLQAEHEQAVINMNALHQAALDRLQEVLDSVKTQ